MENMVPTSLLTLKDRSDIAGFFPHGERRPPGL